jgi:hypothetical protein
VYDVARLCDALRHLGHIGFAVFCHIVALRSNRPCRGIKIYCVQKGYDDFTLWVNYNFSTDNRERPKLNCFKQKGFKRLAIRLGRYDLPKKENQFSFLFSNLPLNKHQPSFPKQI